MASPVSICNQALAELGSTLISSFDEGTSVATLCGELYPDTRDSTLEAHIWNFATRRVMLAQLVDTPPFGWAYQYSMPADYLKARGTDQEDRWSTPRTWAVELNALGHQVIVSNQATLGIVYTARVEDLNLWSPLARQVLVKLLASRLAKPLTGQNSVEQLKLQEMGALLLEAKKSDGREGTPQRLRLPGRLYAARRAHSGVWPYTFVPHPDDP
jgi:hypothetical protein